MAIFASANKEASICSSTTLVLVKLLYVFLLLTGAAEAADESINTTEIFSVLNASLNSIEEILLSFSVIIALLFFIILLGLLFRWIFLSEGIFIKPFIIGSCKESFNGEVISNLLIVEFQRIRQIYDSSHKRDRVDKATLAEGIIHSNPIPISENLANRLADANLSAGGLTVPIGQLVSLIKQQTGHTDRIITGSLEQYESTLSLSAWMWMGPDNVYAWEIKGVDVPSMVKDIALMITTDIIKLDHIDSSAYHLGNLGVAYLGKRNYRDAKSLLREAIRLKSDARIYSALADVLFEEGDHVYKPVDEDAMRLAFEEAIHFYDKSIKMKPDSLFAWNNKGWVLTALGHHEQAITCYDKAIALDNTLAKAWNNKAFSLSRIGRRREDISCFREAINCYEKAIGLNEQFAWPWLHKGWILAREFERYDDAIQCFDRAIQINPRFFWPWHHKGFSLYKLGRFKESIISYKNAIEIDPKSLDSIISLAACYRMIFMKENAKWAKEKWLDECRIARDLSKDIKYEYVLARLGAVCGRIKEPVDLLEDSLDKKKVNISFIEKDFAFDSIRNEPIFMELLSRKIK